MTSTKSTKKGFKGILAITLFSVFLVISLFPRLTLAGGLESTGNAGMDAFINDSRFTAGISWSSRRPVISGYDCSGCCAYCADYVKFCYGLNSPRAGQAFYSVSEIRAGDVLIIGNPGNGTGHWFVCLKRSGNRLYVAEGNCANKVRIGWTYTISGNKFAEDGRSFTTGYHYLGAQPVNHPPIGSFDLGVGGAGCVRVAGWAKDNDTPSVQTSVHVYIGGPAGSAGALGYAIKADAYRSDVGQHAYDTFIQTSKRGTQTVYVYSIDSQGGVNTYIGCKTVYISEKTVSTVANKISINTNTKSVAYSKLKKKSQTVQLSATACGNPKISYTLQSGGNKYIQVRSSGKVTLKKGLKKGTYSLKIKVKAAATGNYKMTTVTKTIKFKVK